VAETIKAKWVAITLPQRSQVAGLLLLLLMPKP
jgi:hypothetical protein